MSANAKKTAATPAATTTNTPAPAPAAPVVTPDLLARLRAAESLDAAAKLLQPDNRRPNPTYTLVETCAAPLPKARGACVRVYAAIARRQARSRRRTLRPNCPTSRLLRSGRGSLRRAAT
ncbi:MAG TPA: hypothetical protein VFX12_09905 [Vicinamibacterales bacterium]|nr:hypothetical protein [Vicinamibacterales bacterium]